MDITIAGGGIIGLAIAWRLAQRGLRIIVRDAGKLAGQASWAGAGMLCPQSEFQAGSEWLHLAVQSLGQYPEFVRELKFETGQSIDFRPCGMRILNEAGLEEPQIASHDAAVVDPRHICSALILAGRKLGVEYRPHDPVTSIAGPTVLAAGAWSSQIAGLPAVPRAYPVKGHLIGFDMPAGSHDEIVRQGHHYLLQRSNGFTIVGSDEYPNEWDLTPDPAAIRRLLHAGGSLWPALRGREPEAVWTGLRPSVVPPNGEAGVSDTGVAPLPHPVVEQAGSELWLAYGHFRNGILLAPVTADRIANLVAGTVSPSSSAD